MKSLIPHAPSAFDVMSNGVLRQESNTAEMIANLWQQIAYLSSAFTLETGDFDCNRYSRGRWRRHAAAVFF